MQGNRVIQQAMQTFLSGQLVLRLNNNNLNHMVFEQLLNRTFEEVFQSVDMGSQGPDQGYLAQVQLEVVVVVVAAAAAAAASLANGRGQGNHLPRHTLLNALMGTYA